MTSAAFDNEEIAASMQRSEEYKIWKKNSPYLYDLVVTHALEWPTLTCQWFPDSDQPLASTSSSGNSRSSDKPYTTHRLLIGTHTSEQDQNYLQIAQVQLPNRDVSLSEAQYDDDKGEVGAYGGNAARVKIVQKINHDGEVNRARYCPQNIDLIATRTVMGPTYIFDRTKHSLNPSTDGKCRPDMVLKGQSKEGYGLSWNPLKQGHILAASEDTTVCHWDINQYKKTERTLQPLQTYRGHTAFVEDVAHHHFHESLFGSVGDDRQFLIWDDRNPGSAGPKQRVADAHAGEINSLAFSPSNEYIACTGSSDKTVGLWDLRNTKVKLHSLESHTDEVLQLSWSPFHETVLASAAADRRVMLWDLSRIGEEQTSEDAEDGPPELVFVHGGHTARTTDIAWSPVAPWHMATAAEDNILMAFCPSENALGEAARPAVGGAAQAKADGAAQKEGEKDEDEVPEGELE